MNMIDSMSSTKYIASCKDCFLKNHANGRPFNLLKCAAQNRNPTPKNTYFVLVYFNVFFVLFFALVVFAVNVFFAVITKVVIIIIIIIIIIKQSVSILNRSESKGFQITKIKLKTV